MRVIVVEDNISLQKGIAYRLRDEGYGVDLLGDGDAASDFLRQEDCDVVVMDINLPGRSGLEVLRELRDRDDARAVILLTARSETSDRVVGLDSGADDYLVKPFEMDELVARIRALARRRERAPSSSVALGPLTLLRPDLLIRPDLGIPLPAEGWTRRTARLEEFMSGRMYSSGPFYPCPMSGKI